ncbi:hypothetical protein HanRHA438_Chr15g0728951 [Helianthus annuus]|nr:hypothetical protein HanRHA438_Chr15g0728951 [Helianthus annuus]
MLQRWLWSVVLYWWWWWFYIWLQAYNSIDFHKIALQLVHGYTTVVNTPILMKK